MLNVEVGPNSCPVGRLTFQFWIAWSISLRPIFCAYSLSGSICTRTAYFDEPCTCTCEPPLTIEMRGAIIDSAKSSSVESGRVSDVTLAVRIGGSVGLVVRGACGGWLRGGR